MDFLAVRSLDPKIPCLFIRVVERLDEAVDVVREAIGYPLKDKIN